MRGDGDGSIAVPLFSTGPLSALDSAKGRAGGVEAKGNLSLPILA